MVEQKELRRGRLEKAEYIFPEMLESMKLGKEFKQRLVVYNWEKIVGKAIAAHAKPVKLEFKRIFIKTTHPAWAEQLKFMNSQLIHKINAYAKEKVVEELVFTNLALKSLAEHDTSNAAEESENIGSELKKIQLSDDKMTYIKNTCQAVTDADLRQSLERLGMNMQKMSVYRQSRRWHKCRSEQCQDLCPPEAVYCQACQRRMRQERAARLNELLLDMPWACYKDVLAEVDCTEQEFKEQRLILLQRLAAKVDYGDNESLNAKLLVMLYRSIPPEQLNEKAIKRTLHQLRYDVHYVPLKKDGAKEKKA